MALPPPPYPGFSPSAVAAAGVSASPASSPAQFKATPPHPGVQIYSDPEEKQRVRFQVELEFVQCLGNPNYLHFLAQRGYFKEANFVNYLSYLLYWKQPKYVKYIKYPVCLHFLELLQHEAFRKEIVNGQCVKFLDDQTILHWQHYTRKRVRLIENATNPAGAAAANAAGSGAGGVATAAAGGGAAAAAATPGAAGANPTAAASVAEGNATSGTKVT